MNIKRWLLASAAVFVVISIVGFVVHQLLLKDLYMQTASVWRPEAEMMKLIWLSKIGCVIVSLMFVFLYAKGLERKKPALAQGLRFGFYVWLFVSIPMCLGWYMVIPIPAALPTYWAIGGLVEWLLAGAAAGLIYKA